MAGRARSRLCLTFNRSNNVRYDSAYDDDVLPAHHRGGPGLGDDDAIDAGRGGPGGHVDVVEVVQVAYDIAGRTSRPQSSTDS